MVLKNERLLMLDGARTIPLEGAADPISSLTVGMLIDRYLLDGPMTKPSKRVSTWRIDRSNLERHIRPLLGSMGADAVTRTDAARAIWDIGSGRTQVDERTCPRGRARVSGGKGTARRTRATAAAMYSWAAEYQLVQTNPFAGVKLGLAPTRQRFLSLGESLSFLSAIRTMEAQGTLTSGFADALRLLLLTGARKTEILGLRWTEAPHDQSVLTLPQERTKAGGQTGERHIVLSAESRALLARRRASRARGAKHVFPSSRGDGPIIGIRKPFLQVCAAAGLEGLRIHDLRHTFASLAVANGTSLYVVGKLLGHADARTTERYAHLHPGPLQSAADAVGSQLTGA